MISRRVGGIALSALLFAGCQQLQQLTGPNTVIPADVRSSQTAAQVTQRMLDQIAANEKKLGRSLAPARIIRVQLLHQGEPYQFKRLDGTDAAIEASADNGPGWVVEAVGTFVGVDIGTSQIDSLGTHGFELWADDGSESRAFLPCWTRQGPAPDDLKEGVCNGPGT